MIGSHRFWLVAIMALVLLPARPSSAQNGGWDPKWPPLEKMLRGRDPTTVQQFMHWSSVLEMNPKDVNALDQRGVLAMAMARDGLYRSFWSWLAAKDLEQAVQLAPNDFFAWHNYGHLNYSSGDLWMLNDHSNALRAVAAFTKAIALNPKSARTYMGRGWAYLTMNDQAHANADFHTALQLDSSLRPDLEREVRNIQERKQQEAAARGTVEQTGRYFVEESAHTAEECEKYKGYWTGGKCRISMALYPGAQQIWEGR